MPTGGNMSFFMSVFLKCTAIIIGITVFAQLLGKVLIKDVDHE